MTINDDGIVIAPSDDRLILMGAPINVFGFVIAFIEYQFTTNRQRSSRSSFVSNTFKV